MDFQLQVLGQPVRVEVELPVGAVSGRELVPAVCEIADAVVHVAVEQTVAAGKTITCGMGCGYCCRQLVRISTAEARAIARLVEGMPEPRRGIVKGRFVTAMEGFRKAGIFAEKVEGKKPRLNVKLADLSDEQWMEFVGDYFRVNIACPFLENESCSIYADRPVVCREYNVTSPLEACKVLDVKRIESLDIGVDVAERFMDLIETLDKPAPRKIALVMAVEWAENSSDEEYGVDEASSLMSYLQLMCSM